MKFFLFIVLTIFAFVVCSAKPAEKYTDKYDNINVDEILSNKRMLENYVNCLLDKGRCSPDGAELKRVLPDAMKTDCEKCTDTQKALGDKVLTHLIDKEPDYWKLLEDKYDPSGNYKKKIDSKNGQ